MFTSFSDKLRRSFSKSAHHYDILTSLHKEIGRELVKKYLRQDAAVILDVGCGTGYVANKAKFFYPHAKVIGLDIAEGMVAKAKESHEGAGIDWIQADAGALPLRDHTTDVIFSNLAYQWVVDLPKAFGQAHRVLTGQGLFAITMFGSRTCEELIASLEQSKVKGLRRLASVEEVKEALHKAGFTQARVEEELIKIQFQDMWDLLTWLKAIGANQLPKQGYIGKNQMSQAAQFYQSRFPYHHGICATFEVIWVSNK